MLTFLALALPLTFSAPPTDEDPIAAWSEDALFLVDELERLHPDPWFGCPREEFETALDAFLQGLDGKDEDRARAGFLRLFAKLSQSGRDGHSIAWPMTGRALPVQLFGFGEGWYVVDALAPETIGARVVTLGGVPVEEVAQRLAPLLTRDNEWNLRAKLAAALTNPELLAGVGIACPTEGLEVELERDGRRETLALAPVSGNHAFLGFRPLPPRAGARWLEGREAAYRLEVLPAERTLYVQYNEVTARDRQGRALGEFVQELERTYTERGLARLVIDVRSNGGGDNTTFRPLIEALKRPPFEAHGTTFVLIGRYTFSAAGNFVTSVERETKAILVGEPTGGAPNQYGDAQTVELPHHRDLLVRISTRYHAFARADDPRLTHEPHVAVPLRASDYFAGRDPVLAAALAYVPPK